MNAKRQPDSSSRSNVSEDDQSVGMQLIEDFPDSSIQRIAQALDLARKHGATGREEVLQFTRKYLLLPAQ